MNKRLVRIIALMMHYVEIFLSDYLLIGFWLSITISNFLLNPCHDYIHQIVLLHLT